MRIFIDGAGVIGSIYALYLSRSGCEAAVLARSRRLEKLRSKGLLYRNRKTIQKAEVQILERLESDARLDHIFLTVRAGQLHHVFYGYLCEGEIT